jgi:hypothetical protein
MLVTELGAESRGGDAADDLKRSVLLSRDLALMSTAVKYDLSLPAEKLRSVRELVRLFFHLTAIFEVDLFIEAGAKDAETSRYAYRKLRPRPRIVAFEANPLVYERFSPINAPFVEFSYEHKA